MFNNKRIFATTGPSVYSPEIKSMVEDYFGGISLYCNQDKEDLDYIISQMDVLLLAGGSDIFPGTYSQPITRGDCLSKFDIRRDKRELYLIKKALEKGIPQLWICRGMQLGCLKFGFHLMPDISGSEIVHQPSNQDIKVNYEQGEFCHYVDCLPEYHDLYFESEGTLSYHHQAIGYFGGIKEKGGLSVVATADTGLDPKKHCRIVEIVESVEHKIVGAQFHPEIDYLYGNVASNKVLKRFKSFLE